MCRSAAHNLTRILHQNILHSVHYGDVLIIYTDTAESKRVRLPTMEHFMIIFIQQRAAENEKQIRQS